MDLTIQLTRIMVLGPIFLALGAVATSVLNAQGRFAAAALAPSVYNVAIIAATLALAPSMGAVGLAIGVVAGSLGHLLVQLPPLRRLGFRYQPIIDLKDAAARQALVLMAPRAIGLGATQITFLVMTGLAAGAGGPTAVTAFTIAFTLLQIPVGVIGVPLAVVLFPSLSREVAIGNHREFVGLLTRALRFLTFVMLPIAVLTAILAVEGVALLFRRFDQAAIELTAVTLQAFLVGLVAHALIAVLARAFYALQDTRTPVAVAIMAVVINTTLAIQLVEPYGLPGMALAIALAAWLEAGGTGGPAPAARRSPGLRGRGLAGRPDGPRDRDRWRGGRVRPRHGRRAPGARPECRRVRRPARPHRRHRDRRGRVHRGLRRRCARLADRGIALYRRDHGRRAPPPAPVVTAPADPSDWDAFVESSDPGSYLQLTPWATVKAVNGWSAHRLHGSDTIGAQILVRRPRPLPWGFAYAPRGPVARSWSAEEVGAFTERVRSDLSTAAGRVSHLRIDPEIELDGPLDPDGALRLALRQAGWRPAPPIQPASTRVIDLRPDEEPRCTATSARSGASTSTRQGPPASWWSTPRATGLASSTGSIATPRTVPGS